jgi:phage shock protein A
VKRYKEADANRFALLAQLRRAGAQQRMRANLSDEAGPMSDFGRMEERIRQDVNYTDALGELDDFDSPPPPPPNQPSPEELERRLQELKRRLGRE